MDLQCSGLLYSPLNCCRCKPLTLAYPSFLQLSQNPLLNLEQLLPTTPQDRLRSKEPPKLTLFLTSLLSDLCCSFVSCSLASLPLQMKGCCFSLSLQLHHCPLLNKNSYCSWEKDKAKKISSPWSRLLRVGCTVGYLFVIRGIYLCQKQPSTLFVESKYKHEALNYI